ncbi:tRNA (adenosine(37)-N6)-dimethylallyltransferase MiaA [Alkalibacillus haloalkaliphilus]|uniref:tRNA dimethylallyltransferase n=1 Tax=Alkalibacillus haloalkaliphilus TaxID=94136 RepID=A0A511W3S5_9BACI|nr:tRNA (adenosine(37)-N6)-dimethylallyltransferase MiaA [Alkalibacillus haloalkaliphilus]GEN44998.1 tRNA dimethylallyltransferase [Alkalibacillus haloalkaliphilus]
MKPVLVSVIGPTAVGKTKLGIEISKRFNGEVINGDSMQVYQQFNIGSAKVTDEEAEGIPHHLIDLLSPENEYSAARFKEDLQVTVDEITERSKLPVLVGGTGFYIQSALYNFNFSSVERDEEYVEKATEDIKQNGVVPYYNKLKEVDPVQANKIHPNNIRRVVRALEVFDRTGKPMSQYEAEQTYDSPYNAMIIGLDMERETLYERINQRVDEMIEEGLIVEVRNLYQTYGSDIQPMQGIGYKEWVPYLKGERGFDETVELVKQNTRKFAKRQLTYYRNKLDRVHWYTIDPEHYAETFETIFEDLAGFLKELEE